MVRSEGEMLVYHEEYASNLEYTLHVHGSELEALFRKAYRGWVLLYAGQPQGCIACAGCRLEIGMGG